jgi:small subunit ribosomal protein S4e
MSKHSKHKKRLAAPRSWAIPRKGKVWVPKSSPGKHALEESIPVMIAIRDYLQLCDTAGEAKRVIGNRGIFVDGVAVRSNKMPIGLMDVLSIPKMKAYYRVLMDKRGKIRLVTINKEDSGWKLCRINNKTKVKGGKIQLNLHDGRNIVVDKDEFKTGDTLKISIPKQEILGKIEFTEGHLAFLTGGSHVGYLATIEKIERTRNPKANVVHFAEKFSTHQDYVFIVGTDASVIDIPEVVT